MQVADKFLHFLVAVCFFVTFQTSLSGVINITSCAVPDRLHSRQYSDAAMVPFAFLVNGAFVLVCVLLPLRLWLTSALWVGAAASAVSAVTFAFLIDCAYQFSDACIDLKALGIKGAFTRAHLKLLFSG